MSQNSLYYLRTALIDAGVDGPAHSARNFDAPEDDDDQGEHDIEERHDQDDGPAPSSIDWFAAQLGGPDNKVDSTRDLTAEALDADPADSEAANGMDPIEWLSWACAAPPAEWEEATREAGSPGAARPDLRALPHGVRVAVEQYRLDVRIAAAERGRR